MERHLRRVQPQHPAHPVRRGVGERPPGVERIHAAQRWQRVGCDLLLYLVLRVVADVALGLHGVVERII